MILPFVIGECGERERGETKGKRERLTKFESMLVSSDVSLFPFKIINLLGPSHFLNTFNLN
jgi:hypothetical protein